MNNKALRTVLLTCAFALCVGVNAADASTYKLYAVYAKHSKPSETVRVEVAKRQMLHHSGAKYFLDRVEVEFDKVAVAGKLLSTTLEEFRFSLRCSPNKYGLTRTVLPVSQIKPGVAYELLPADIRQGVSGRYPIDHCQLDVVAVYKRSYLCGVEQLQRSGKAKRKKAGALAAVLGYTGKGWYTKPLEYSVRGKEKYEVFYSFCDEFRPKSGDLSKVRQGERGLGGVEEPNTKKSLMAVHKAAMFRLLADHLVRPVAGKLLHQPLLPSAKKRHVFVRTSKRFDIARGFAGAIGALELTAGKACPLENLVDDQSQLAVTFDRVLCRTGAEGCARGVMKSLKVYLVGKDSKGNTFKTEVQTRYSSPNRHVLKIKVANYIGQALELHVERHLGPLKDALFIKRFEVKNIGLVTTFPVLSEISTFLGHVKLNDPEALSTVPFSWAVRVSGDPPNKAAHVAIMLPWVVGWNTRKAPDLARYLAIFAHASLLFSVADNEDGQKELDNIGVAFGAGLRVAEVFAFAWGVDVEHKEHYLFVGLSVTDIAKLGMWWR